MIFMCIMDYGDKDAVARVRPKHQAYMHRLIAEGKVISAGGFVSDDDGGLFLYDAPSLEAAQALVSDDPYILAGVIRGHKLREYEIHGVNPALLRVTG
jgi:uncharacterized protein YciI